MPIIGAAETAFDRLPFFWQQALLKSSLVDIETTGLEPTQGHMPVSGAKMRFGKGVPRRLGSPTKLLKELQKEQ